MVAPPLMHILWTPHEVLDDPCMTPQPCGDLSDRGEVCLAAESAGMSHLVQSAVRARPAGRRNRAKLASASRGALFQDFAERRQGEKKVRSRSLFSIESLGQGVVEFLRTEVASANPCERHEDGLFFGDQADDRSAERACRRVFVGSQRSAPGVVIRVADIKCDLVGLVRAGKCLLNILNLCVTRLSETAAQACCNC
jgi:hypothetical protein